MTIKAVFFDMYGTLAGFRPSRFEVQSEACGRFGIEVTPEGITAGYALADAFMAKQNAVSPVRLLSPADTEDFFAEYERLVLRGAGVDVTAERALEVWRAVGTMKYGFAAFDDVVPVLDALSAWGLVIGMITNIARDGAGLAASIGLTGRLDVIVTSGDVRAEKPSRLIFDVALRQAGVEARDAVHVGDQPTTDIDGALGAGLAAVLIDRDGNHPGFHRCPRIQSLFELADLLDAMA